MIAKNAICLISGLIFSVYIMGDAFAEVRFDGSLGEAGPVNGKNYSIDASRGRKIGGNLFHSFATFNIASDETATFNDAEPTGSINNIIARVTGGGRSSVDGGLISRIPNANLIFINPAGITFGPTASINLPGAFYASSADYLKLSDAGRFNSSLDSDSENLTGGSPEAFGFLAEQKSTDIRVDKSFLFNALSLSLIADEINITESSNLFSGSLLRLETVLDGGEVNFDTKETMALASSGDINIGDTSSSVSVIPGPGLITGDKVMIRAGNLVLKNSASISNTDFFPHNDGDATIDLKIHDAITVAGKDASIDVKGEGQILNIEASQVNVSNGAEISNSNTVEGSKTNNHSFIHADEINVIGLSDDSSNQSKISAAGLSDVELKAGIIRAHNGGVIESQGGDISIDATKVVLDGVKSSQRAGIFALAGQQRIDSGDIHLRAKQLNILNGSRISTSNTATSKTNIGVVSIEAKQILVDGVGGLFKSSIQAEDQRKEVVRGGNHNGGVRINAEESLTVSNNATISARTLGPGDGGKVIINGDQITVESGGAITSESTGSEANAGRAGTIDITADDSLVLASNGEITVDTERADAGDINITTDLLRIKNQSRITTSVAGGNGNGGNIDLNLQALMLTDESRIKANALEGKAGNISIQINQGGALFQSSDSVIEASSALGIDGNVEINAPDVNINSGFKPLAEDFVDAATVIEKPCAQRFQGKTIQFLNQKYQVLPDSPYGLRTVFYKFSDETGPNQSAAANVKVASISDHPAKLTDCF